MVYKPTMKDLSPKQEVALTKLIDAVEALMDLGPAQTREIEQVVAEWGTDHEYGQTIDMAVIDCLDSVIECM